MTTERMTDDELTEKCIALQVAANEVAALLACEAARARSVEQEQAEEIRNLKEMLRLANDKMAEQVRQARWEVATEGLKQPTDGDEHRYLAKVRDANAPKD